MKKGLIFPVFLVVAVSIALPTSAKADDAGDFFHFFRWFHASWKGEAEENGKKKTVSGKCTGSGGRCNIYVGTGETSVWGYDPKHKTWTGVGHLENGSRFLRKCHKPKTLKEVKAGVKISMTGTTWHTDGTIEYETTTFTCLDANTGRWHTKRKDQDGKALPPITMIAKKVKP